jgi:hypothetical protein
MGVLGELWVKLGLKNEEFKKGIDEAQGKTKTFGEGVKKVSTAVKAAWAAVGVAAFKLAKDMAEAAAQAEGVANQFKKIADAGALEALRKATRNTVSDLELMKVAIKASNFNIPIKNLATYFEFATKRAIETGESIDYLVDSIITGLGRESVMILDNLGISSAKIKEEMEGGASMADALGKIIQEDLSKAGETASTSAVSIAQVNAAWENLKVTIGGSDVIQRTLLAITNGLSSMVKGIDEVAKKGGIAAYNRYVEIDEEVNYLKAMGKSEEEILNILNTKVSELKSKLGTNWLDNFFKNGFKTGEIEKQIGALQDYIKTFEKVEQTVVSSPIATPKSNTASSAPIATPKSNTAFKRSITIGGVVPTLNVPKPDTNLPKLDFEAVDQMGVMVDNWEKQTERASQVADIFNEAVAGSIVNSLNSITDAIANGESLSFGKVVSNLLTPLADAAISAGMLMLSTGTGIEALKDSLLSLNGTAAIAAGAALVAVGTAAKIGLASIGKNMGNTNPSYTYSGGGYGVNMATQASNQQVEVVGVLKGQDIYLASEKYQQSRKR